MGNNSSAKPSSRWFYPMILGMVKDGSDASNTVVWPIKAALGRNRKITN